MKYLDKYAKEILAVVILLLLIGGIFGYKKYQALVNNINSVGTMQDDAKKNTAKASLEVKELKILKPVKLEPKAPIAKCSSADVNYIINDANGLFRNANMVVLNLDNYEKKVSYSGGREYIRYSQSGKIRKYYTEMRKITKEDFKKKYKK